MISSFASVLEEVAHCFDKCNGFDYQDSQLQIVDCIEVDSDDYDDDDVEWKCCTQLLDNNLVAIDCCNETMSHNQLKFH